MKRLEDYLNRLERDRKKDEPNNPRAYANARTLSTWLSLYKYGNADVSKLAGRILKRWCGE